MFEPKRSNILTHPSKIYKGLLCPKIERTVFLMAKAKKLPSGSWRVQATITVDGEKLRKSFTAPDRRSAELAAAKWQAGQAEQPVEHITLKKAYEKYISAKENVLSPSTIKGYKALSRTSLSDIMDMRIDKLTTNLIQRSINVYAATHKPKGVRNCAGLLSAVMQMFRPEMNLHITLPQKEKKDVYIPDDDMIKKVIEITKDTRFEIPVLLAAFGPMRRGEICALESSDINENIITVSKSLVKTTENKWVLKPPKTFSSYRRIEYPDFVIEKLKGIKGKITDMTPDAITDGFLKVLRKNGLPEFRFHDLRHYAVSTLHAINIPDKYIMARGGWSTNHTMNTVYNHILQGKADSVEKEAITHFTSIFNQTV